MIVTARACSVANASTRPPRCAALTNSDAARTYGTDRYASTARMTASAARRRHLRRTAMRAHVTFNAGTLDEGFVTHRRRIRGRRALRSDWHRRLAVRDSRPAVDSRWCARAEPAERRRSGC